MPEFSQRLTILREKKGWSKAETARKLGLKAPSTYGNWEYGIREPDLGMISNIAKLYDVSVDYLIGQELKENNQVSKRKINIKLEQFCLELQENENFYIDNDRLTPEVAAYLHEALLFALKQAQFLNKSFQKL